MGVDQVVTGQIHRGVVHRVDEVGLHHCVVGVLHGIGRVYHVDLETARVKAAVKASDWPLHWGHVQANALRTHALTARTSTLKSLLM